MKKSAIALMPTLTLVCLLLMGSAFAGDNDKRDHDRDRHHDHDWGYDLTHINPRYMITPQEAWDWNYFKGQVGPTYGGSPGWITYHNFLVSTVQEFGAVDLAYIDIPYNRYVVNDWPDPNTHIYGSGVEVEKLVSDGTGVPVVATYGMTSGFTPSTGVTAPMLYYDPANPPTKAEITGKILVFQTVPYPSAVPGINPPYSYTASVLGSYAITDSEYRTPGYWYPEYSPVPASVTSSYHSRWVWGQLGGFATIGINGGQATAAAGMVIVYDLSPGAALGLTQRSVYTPTGTATASTVYTNVPTLCLDRVNGAKVLADAKAGKTATLTLIAHFEIDTSGAFLGYLPGKYYGTPQDQQIFITNHTDAMSLVEDNGALGMLGMLYYFSHIPQSERPRTLIFYFDGRHFMPGGESAWPQYSYYYINPEALKPIVAAMGVEHMGGRQTIEVGPDGNDYVYSPKGPNSGGYISSFIDLYNNNLWSVEAVAKAAKDNNWPRVFATAGGLEPGVNGGYQMGVKAFVRLNFLPLAPQIPEISLAGDWPGAWTQTYSQLGTEAGFPGFEKDYFVTQVAGLSQIVGEMMAKDNLPIVIDLGWGQIKSGLVCTLPSICTTTPPTGLLPDSQFVTPANAPAQRRELVAEYVAAFRDVERGAYADATSKLQTLEANITKWISQPNQTALVILINNQIAKLP